MYKRPSKRTQRIQLIALYSIMTVTVITVVAILVLVVSNYGFNRETGTLQQRGLVQFASIPSGANVTIDNFTLSSRTGTKQSVEPGKHSFTISRNGYEPWRLETSVSAGSLVWLNYARLVPTDRTNQVVRVYPSIAASSAAPDKRSVLLQPDRTLPEFRLVDISRDQPAGHEIKLDPTLFDIADESQVSDFELGSWDVSGRYIIIHHTRGSVNETIVMDTRNPDRSVNVSREFSIPISEAILSGRSGNILYVLTEGSLRKIDVSGGTISRSLVGEVEQFSLYDTNAVTFVAGSADEGVVRVAGVYREGDESPTVLRSVKEDIPLSIASHEYYSSTYTAITEGDQLTVYRGQYDEGLKGLNRVARRNLDNPATKVEFNDAGSYVVAYSDYSFTSYGLERQLFATTDLGGVSSRDMFWLDSMNLGLVVDGQMTMRNLDGTNLHNLTASAVGHQGTLSRNGTYFYSLSSTADGNAMQLQRFRMILR